MQKVGRALPSTGRLCRRGPRPIYAVVHLHNCVEQGALVCRSRNRRKHRPNFKVKRDGVPPVEHDLEAAK